ncbi:hypothetical protein ACFY84_25600 [Streptomyces sp. NPDC012438]|uniref:hypothetical protein n=1 Tax=Streptomyces sp. NPDC012438 TaxID=3364833 RepID=UPI0036F0E122
MAYAQEWDIALFRYSLNGAMTPLNAPARRIENSAAAPKPAASPAPAAAHRPRPTGDQSFWERHWRVIAGVLLLIAPLRSLGDESIYSGPFVLDALKFIGILLACWALGAFLIATRSGARVAIRLRPFRLSLVPRSTAAAQDTDGTRDRQAHSHPGSTFTPAHLALVIEAAHRLSSGSKQHHVDQFLKERGVGFMDRGRILNEAKRRNKHP